MPPISPKLKTIKIESPIHQDEQTSPQPTNKNKPNPEEGTSLGAYEYTVELSTDNSSNNSNDESSSSRGSSKDTELIDDTMQRSGVSSIAQEISTFTTDNQTTEMRWEKLWRYFDSLTEEAITDEIIIDYLNMARNPTYNTSLGVENVANDIFPPFIVAN